MSQKLPKSCYIFLFVLKQCLTSLDSPGTHFIAQIVLELEAGLPSARIMGLSYLALLQ